MAQPFMIRPPLELLLAYKNDLQAMARATQEGYMSPLELTLAAQKKKEMDAAGQSAQAPTQTVAEKLLGTQAPPPPPPMGGVGAPPPMLMQGPPAGLGATPEAAQMQAPMPAMGAPEMPMEEAPMGMAEGGMVPPYASGGGLSQAPIPAGMFDEPNNGGYANGGIVAFGAGGYNDFRKAIVAQESGGRYGIPNRQGSGAMGIGQIMPDTARALAKRLGREYRPDLLAGTDEASREYQNALTDAATKEAWEYGKGDAQTAAKYYFAGPNKKGWGDKTAKYGADILGRLGQTAPATAGASAAADEGAITLASVPNSNLAGEMVPAYERAGEFYDKFMPKPKTAARDKLKARVEEGLSEESQKKEKNYDKWATLAEIGFNIAGSNSPNFLQAVGAAASAALPGAKKSKEAREARFDKYLSQYAEIEGIENSEARERVKFMLDLGKTELDLKYKDMTLDSDVWKALVQDNRTRIGQINDYNASIYGTNKGFEASMAGNSAQSDAILKQGYNLAYQAAGEDVKSMPEYIEGDAATREKIFNDALKRRISAYQRMVGGGSSSDTQLPPGFQRDK